MVNSDDSLSAVNERLKAAGLRISIYRPPGRTSLYLRGSLPPKPGAADPKWKQQIISLGLRDTPNDLRQAERMAHKVGAEVQAETFDWSDYVKGQSGHSVGSCAEWIRRFHDHIVGRWSLEPEKAAARWRVDYWNPALKWLPPDGGVCATVLTQAALHYKPNTRSRKLCCQILTQFGKFAELEGFSLKSMEGNYSFYKPLSADIVLPTDDEMLEIYDSWSGIETWRNVLGLQICYGLRNHEAAAHVTLERRHNEIIAIVPSPTKTGYREVWPMWRGWAENWFSDKLEDALELPNITWRINKEIGDRVSKQYTRHGVPRGQLYRHAYAIRCIRAGFSTEVISLWMGCEHRLIDTIYSRFIQSRDLDEIYEQTLQRRGELSLE